MQGDLDANGLLNTRWATMQVLESRTHPELVGRTIASVAAERGTSPFEALCDLTVDDACDTRVNITFANDEEDGVTIIQVTHSNENATYGTKVVRLQDGMVVNK